MIPPPVAGPMTLSLSTAQLNDDDLVAVADALLHTLDAPTLCRPLSRPARRFVLDVVRSAFEQSEARREALAGLEAQFAGNKAGGPC